MSDAAARFLVELQARLDAAPDLEDVHSLHRWISDTEHLLLSDLLTDAEERAVLDKVAPDTLRRSQDLFCAFETMIEKSLAHIMSTSAFAALDSPDNITQNYRKRYRVLAGEEVRLSAIGPKDAALFIGSGPLPISAIEYVRQTGCRVDCVDHLPEPIEISSRVVERLGLKDHFRFFHAKGQEFPMVGYSVILVGVLAQPKAEILERVDREASPDCRLLCRTTTGLRQFIYARTPPQRLERLGPAGFSLARRDQTISTQLLTRASTKDRWERSSRPPADL